MKFILIIAILVALIAIAVAVIEHIRTRKLTDRLGEVLDSAIDGNFTESSYDESVESLLESKLNEYLSSSSLSAKKVEEEKDKIKTLISDISHQTKTPIANLMLYSELLAEEDLSESAREKVAAISSQSEKLKFLIDSLVKMSRLESGLMNYVPVVSSVDELLESITDSLSSKASSKGISISYEPTTLYINSDPKWTYEAIFNIADNAVKYTHKGGVKMYATEYEMFVRIDIEDTGIGISEEDSAKVFSRFYRSREVSEEEGVGIGLCLAREIVTGVGGYIRLESTPGKGSKFSVYIPKGKNLSEVS
ncbi:MAG: HAMP domain-containing histidine kinase [Saccharofermentans sp.]|nr:HAMP domain-containing histidine kinase [Saccharofermentans sp.]